MSAKKKIDLYLGEVYKQFIAIKDDDFKKSQEVFKGVFDQVKAKMGEQCNFFGTYSSQVLFAGSVYDGIKVSKMDEFDMDIVIRMPINYDEGIVIENDEPGFVRLKIDAFDHLDKQPNWEKRHKVTREWRDDNKYFLQNKFRHWMHSTVQKALNELNGMVTVNDVTYLVKYKESGPAYTLNIENDKGNQSFKLDVDLVPVIRFMYPRWPEGYRTVDEGIVKTWLVVPKPNKAISDGSMKNRCWRLSFQDFEKEMMKGCQQLKNTIRLVKKLRDSLQMKDIASYYIKTLFLWKIDETKDKKFWENKVSVTFRLMVNELYHAIKEKNIRYFWHEDNNLIENMKPTVQKLYVDKLKAVLDSIDSNEVDKVISQLLTVDEFQEFKRSEFYQKQPAICTTDSSIRLSMGRQESVSSVMSFSSNSDTTKPDFQDESSVIDLVKTLNNKINSLCTDNQKRLQKIESDTKATVVKVSPMVDLLKSMNEKIDALGEKFADQNERLEKLESTVADRENLAVKMDALMEKIDEQCEKLMKLEMVNNKKIIETIEIDHNEIRLTA